MHDFLAFWVMIPDDRRRRSVTIVPTGGKFMVDAIWGQKFPADIGEMRKRITSIPSLDKIHLHVIPPT
jgi:hypothetical protein